MVERIIIALAVVAIGLIAYAGLLRLQRRRVTQGSKRGDRTGRSALLVFTSPTCAPCKLQQLPIVDRVLIDWHDKIDYELIDVAERPEAATQYGVWSVPTTIVLDAQRQVIAINQGVVFEKKLREQLAQAALNQPISESANQAAHMLTAD
jgi:thioredoxin-like negative regulator of GroEL